MKTVILESDTIGEDIDFSVFDKFGKTVICNGFSEEGICDAISDADILVINKTKVGEHNLKYAKKLKIVCIAATGYDNIDTDYCKKCGIAVCNVKGYSSNSVAQLTLSMALSLSCRLYEYTEKVRSGAYSHGKTANILTPPYHELFGKTWGIIGYGNIGKNVAKAAEALGMKVIVNKRTKLDGIEITDLDALLKSADVISIHTPLTSETENLISREKIALIKNDAIVINVARGKVCDEQALADAIKENKIGALGVDVYSAEPFGENHPFYAIKDYPNVCLTPHMAWAAYEARVRCIDEIIKNIDAFLSGEIRNRVDI